MAKPLLLYSVNTKLAYSIAELYYGGMHYAWCSPYFDARDRPGYNPSAPPSSNPCEILQGLREEVRRGDRHSKKIEQNRVGIIGGAARHVDAGTISEDQREEIEDVVKSAELADFRPLLYIIPYNTAIARIARRAGVAERAHPLAEEYIIAALPRRRFDVLDFYRA